MLSSPRKIQIFLCSSGETETEVGSRGKSRFPRATVKPMIFLMLGVGNVQGQNKRFRLCSHSMRCPYQRSPKTEEDWEMQGSFRFVSLARITQSLQPVFAGTCIPRRWRQAVVECPVVQTGRSLVRTVKHVLPCGPPNCLTIARLNRLHAPTREGTSETEIQGVELAP